MDEIVKPQLSFPFEVVAPETEKLQLEGPGKPGNARRALTIPGRGWDLYISPCNCSQSTSVSNSWEDKSDFQMRICSRSFQH